MAEEQLKQLRQKLESQERQFEAYKIQCKKLQEFLEAQVSKKEIQIRKLKEQAISKQKKYKTLNTESGQLQNEILNLKNQLMKLNRLNSSEGENMARCLMELQSCKSDREKLLKQIKHKNQLIQQLQNQITQFQAQLTKKDNLIIDGELKNSEYMQKIEDLKLKNMQILEKTTRKAQKRQQNLRQMEWRKEREILEQHIIKLQEKNIKLQKGIKDLRQRLLFTIQNSPKKQSKKNQKEEQTQFSSFVNYFCILLTKPHYISPFLEINQQKKIVKFYKAARNGCFQKALGSTKHKFDFISYESQKIVNQIVSKVQLGNQDEQHAVLVFGPKKSGKISIISYILKSLRQFLINKMKDEDKLELIYIRKESDEKISKQKNSVKQEEIIEILDSIIQQGQHGQKRIVKKLSSMNLDKSMKKKIEKPSIRYFRLQIKLFNLELSTSSYANISLKQKTNLTNMLNDILYSKLPDVLMSLACRRYLVLTVNPIVDLYEECKNILSLTLCKTIEIKENKEEWNEWGTSSPLKEDLNKIAKKKLAIYERQIQSIQIKCKKTEQDCQYYRHKFDQLQFRLKNLLSTHGTHSSHLKKSPILLSYEQLLKFVHGVKAKNLLAQSEGNSIIKMNQLEFDRDDSSDSVL